MKTLELNIPDSLEMKEYELLMLIATKLYEDAKLSAGQAAEMVGISKKAFIELLGKNNVSVFSNSISDLHIDIDNA